MTSNDEITEAARSGEPDRYLSALLAPEAKRADLITIAAFAAEMRRIPLLVKEPMMGEIRLQWWRDTLSTNPAGMGTLAKTLSTTVERHRLPLHLLQAMTEARAFDLYDDAMPDEAAFDGYLAKTEAAPFTLALLVVGADGPAALADSVGRAYGMARLLVDLPQWLARGRLPLPATYLADAGVDAESLRLDQSGPGVTRLFDRLLTRISADATAARAMARHIPHEQRSAVLPIATIPTYLRAFRHGWRGPVRPVIEVPRLSRIARIARGHWLGL